MIETIRHKALKMGREAGPYIVEDRRMISRVKGDRSEPITIPLEAERLRFTNVTEAHFSFLLTINRQSSRFHKLN